MQDRFVPSRAGLEHFASIYNVQKGERKFDQYMGQVLLGDLDAQLMFPSRPFRSDLGFHVRPNANTATPAATCSSVPTLVLDAPDIVCDYYLNLLDWGKSDTVSLALGKTVWNCWNQRPTSASPFVTSDSLITSVRWNPSGDRLAVGLNNGTIIILDLETGEQVQSFENHTGGVNALSWRTDQFFSSGGDDHRVIHHDSRQHEIVYNRRQHVSKVCGLAWSPDGSTLASGSEDNSCNIWDIGRFRVRCALGQHSSAVKALAWSPVLRNQLATGAGTYDRHIRIFDTSSGECLKKHKTDSQVSSLIWVRAEKTTELLSTHGFLCPDVIQWTYPKFQKIKTYKKHSGRVLHSALSPDSSTVCSVGADERLCFWKIWPEADDPAREAGSQRLVPVIR